MKIMNPTIFKTAAAAILLLAAVSCKHKDEEDTKATLGSSPAFTIEPYHRYGESLTLTPKKVDSPADGVEIGYSWQVSSLMSKRDTSEFEDGHFTFKFDKDTLGSFTVSCSAFAKNSSDYYSTSATAAITLVKAGLNTGSITGIPLKSDDSTFSDVRAGQPDGVVRYYITKIGSQMWFKQNLAYTTNSRQYGLAYLDCEAASDVFGRFYSWEEAKTVCPSGWHLPSEAELMAAVETSTGLTLNKEEDWKDANGAMMVYAKFNDTVLWEYWPDVKVTNNSGFSALPFGYCNLGDKTFNGITKTAAFWTADEFDAEKAVYRYMVDDEPYIYRGYGDKEYFGASVRCVRD